MNPLKFSSILALLVLCSLAENTNAQTLEPQPLDDSPIEVHAYWERLTDTVYKFEEKFPLIRDLSANEAKKSYRSKDFSPFLPSQAVNVGEAWKIDPHLVVPMLQQFHRGARADLHHDGGLGLSAKGGWGCLSALSTELAVIYVRIHAEFLLEGNGEHSKSSWFTPAQFQGKLVIDRSTNRVVGFQLGVPSQQANVDVNVSTGKEGLVADIGRIPRMELIGGTIPNLPKDAKQISDAEAQDLLARKFYSLAEVGWLDLCKARAVSLKTGKPLHVIALFGSLMDESC